MKRKSLETILWIAVILCFVLLFVQTQWHPISMSLKNDTTGGWGEENRPKFTLSNAINGSFQDSVNTYLIDNYAFREIAIRADNQYYYTVYKRTCNEFFRPGKDHWMYYNPGVLDYYGQEAPKHFKTDKELRDYVDHQVEMLNELRGILKDQYGIELLSFIGPDKAFIYPEHLPDMERDTSMGNAADYFAMRFKETGFPNIDMKPMYQAIADTSSRLLFMPMDSHWGWASVYGFDSLFRFMDSLNQFGIPRMKINAITESPYVGRQNDEATINLLFKVKNDTPLYTVDISVISDSTSRKPKTLFVGDSFIFAYERLIPKKELTSYYENWFYYDIAYKGFWKQEYKVKEINRLRSILNVDFIVLYSVGYQWSHGTRGFVEDALASIKDPEQVAVALLMNRIERDPGWMSSIREKADKAGRAVEKQLELDAQWMLQQKQ